MNKTRQALKSNINIARLSEDELLNLRICDLSISIEGTWLEDCIQQLYDELQGKGLIFRPVCYLADEWLTPEDEPVIGIPFYLAHPILIALEKKMMLEAEGETKEECMKLLRHETGHAICYAYRLNKKKSWQKIFGLSSREYADTYRFRPYSKNYVRHLEDYYAQYHPDEDFVETFAVWLTPNQDWENKYRGWKALRKLQFVGELMNDLRGKEPRVKRGTKYWKASTLKITLKNFYKKKRTFWAEEFPDFHDTNLKRIFTERTPENKEYPLAAGIINNMKKSLIDSISKWTGERKYIVNDILKTLYQRCKNLNLVALESEAVTVLRVATYVTTLVMNYRYTGWLRGTENKK